MASNEILTKYLPTDSVSCVLLRGIALYSKTRITVLEWPEEESLLKSERGPFIDAAHYVRLPSLTLADSLHSCQQSAVGDTAYGG